MTLLDIEAAKAGERYVAFLLTLRGLYETTIVSAPHDIRALGDMEAGSISVADRFISTEVDILDVLLDSAKAEAIETIRKDIEGSENAPLYEGDDFSDDLIDWFRQELTLQVYRDVNVMVQARRDFALEQSRAKFSTRYPRIRPNKPNFMFTDRAGRKYPSQKFYRNLFRQTILTFAVESAAMDVASFGIETVFVTHPDHNNHYHGTPISLSGMADMLSLHDIRDEVFHPNSNAFLTTINPK